MDTRRSGRYVLLGILVGGAVANLVQFPAIETRTLEHYRALYRYDTADLAEIGLQTGSTAEVNYHFGAALAVGRIAPGATFVAPEGSELPRMIGERQLFGLGRVEALQRRAYDEHAVPEVDDLVVVRGDGGRGDPPFRIAVREGDVDRLVLFSSDEDGAITIVDDRLLDDDHPAAAR